LGPRARRSFRASRPGWRRRGINPEGLAVVYHSVDQATGDFDIQPALFVASPVGGEGELAAGETAGGEALYALHVGRYGSLGETWGQVFARAAALGRPVTKPSWEAYLNTPADVPPEDLRTEIFVPVD
jgi:effector-binding domain-containing protein